ncbi:MAG: 6-phospho-beta-glucosidase, partial [Planctomycetes bacterium]|nr:6-phospho-beta-glucosidase [Planctomycetota bacterium]
MQVAVLGGSSPFTLAFVRELARRAAELETVALRLVGRDRDALALVGAAARAHVTPLGWTVEATDSLARGLAGADHIVQQIRFEGLTGRADDEAFAHELGCPADET